MRGLIFRCPTTGRDIDPGIEDAEPRQSGTSGLRVVALHVRCQHCGEHHEIKIDDAVLTEAA